MMAVMCGFRGICEFCVNPNTITIMKAILVATDFSPSASNAAHYAAHLAVQLQVEHLILYHAYQMMPVSTEVPVNLVRSMEQLQENSEESLQRLKQNLLNVTGSDMLILIKAEFAELVEGSSNLAKVCEAGLIVIGSSGKGFGDRLLMGSATRKLLKKCPFPLLVVPGEATFRPIRKMLLGCDLSQVADTIPIVKLIQLVKGFHAQLQVVNVTAGEQEDSGKAKEEHAFYDLFEDLDPSVQYIEGSDVSKGILAYAVQHEVDMIMVVAKKHTFLERLTKTSVSNKLASKSDIPLLIIRR